MRTERTRCAIPFKEQATTGLVSSLQTNTINENAAPSSTFQLGKKLLRLSRFAGRDKSEFARSFETTRLRFGVEVGSWFSER